MWDFKLGVYCACAVLARQWAAVFNLLSSCFCIAGIIVICLLISEPPERTNAAPTWVLHSLSKKPQHMLGFFIWMR